MLANQTNREINLIRHLILNLKSVSVELMKFTTKKISKEQMKGQGKKKHVFFLEKRENDQIKFSIEAIISAYQTNREINLIHHLISCPLIPKIK